MCIRDSSAPGRPAGRPGPLSHALLITPGQWAFTSKDAGIAVAGRTKSWPGCRWSALPARKALIVSHRVGCARHGELQDSRPALAGLRAQQGEVVVVDPSTGTVVADPARAVCFARSGRIP